MNFEDNIRKLLEQEYKKRIELNNGKYTELQFAKDLGLGKDSMHTYLTGKRVPNADSLVRIANGLNVSVDYLLGLSNKKSIEPTEDEKAIARVSELTGLCVENLNKLTKNGEHINMYLDNILMLDDSIELFISICNYLFFKKSDRCDENDEIEFKFYNRTKKEFLGEDYETYKYSFDDYLNLKLLTIQKRLIEMRKSE